MTNLDSILKSRDITLLTEVHLVKTMVFPVVIYGCESWTIKKAEPWRTDAFELWYWIRLLRVPWTARRFNQLILKEISPEYSLEAPDAEAETPSALATWCEKLTHLKRPWCWERLKLGGEGDNRGWDGWMISLTQLTWVWASSGSWWWTGKTGVLQSMGLQGVGHNWVTELKAREVYIFPWYIEDNFHLSLSAFYASKLKSLLKLFSLPLLPDQSWPSSFSTFDVVTTFLFFEFYVSLHFDFLFSS